MTPMWGGCWMNHGRLASWSLGLGLLALGCERPSQEAAGSADERVVLAPARRALTGASGIQGAPAPGTVVHSPDVSPAPVAGATLEARVLVITADGTDPALGAITGALARLGVPFDVRNATTAPPLVAADLADG